MFLPKLFKGLEILFCSLQMANHKHYQEDLFNFFLNCSVSLMSHLHSIIYRFDFNANRNLIVQIFLNSLIYQCLRCYRSLFVILAILPWHSNAFFLRNLNMFKDCYGSYNQMDSPSILHSVVNSISYIHASCLIPEQK